MIDVSKCLKRLDDTIEDISNEFKPSLRYDFEKGNIMLEAGEQNV